MFTDTYLFTNRSDDFGKQHRNVAGLLAYVPSRDRSPRDFIHHVQRGFRDRGIHLPLLVSIVVQRVCPNVISRHTCKTRTTSHHCMGEMSSNPIFEFTDAASTDSTFASSFE
ncbi:hypothetical protein EVAR_807_1 [Eumeta japonica]|uniref:Uncharacterized protein n=1 Tax=Eumeta variegata TaxID=151549 RepID=A0A4C1SCY8_EUMVA|nr:hypothetical protein EVAR_807_1 [Eumeta japonica]